MRDIPFEPYEKKRRRIGRCSGEMARMTCKPNSVKNGYLSRRTVAGTLKRYGGVGGQPTASLILHRTGFTCARRVAAAAVVSYTAIPTLPFENGGLFLLHFP